VCSSDPILLILNKSNNKYKETMITTFEDQTHPLTDYELKTLLPLMIQGFTTKIGKTRSVTNAQICKALNNKGYDVNEPRIRKLVFYIRQQNLVPNLIASSKGYWIATDINEVDTWIDSLQSRIDAIKETLNYATKLKENFSDLNY
jgi:hypothetical protein